MEGFFFFFNRAVLFGRPSLRYYKEIPLEIKQVSVTVSTSFIGCRIFYNNEATECGKDWCSLINIHPHTWGAGGLVFICPWHIDGSESSRKTQLLSYLLPSLTLLFTNELYTFISRQRTDWNKMLINYQYGDYDSCRPDSIHDVDGVDYSRQRNGVFSPSWQQGSGSRI